MESIVYGQTQHAFPEGDFDQRHGDLGNKMWAPSSILLKSMHSKSQ